MISVRTSGIFCDIVWMPDVNLLQQSEQITEDSSELVPQEVHDQDGVPLLLFGSECCDTAQDGAGKTGQQTVEDVVPIDVALDDCNKDVEKDKESVKSQKAKLKSLKNQKKSGKSHQRSMLS